MRMVKSPSGRVHVSTSWTISNWLDAKVYEAWTKDGLAKHKVMWGWGNTWRRVCGS